MNWLELSAIANKRVMLGLGALAVCLDKRGLDLTQPEINLSLPPDLCSVPIVAGEQIGIYDKRIMRIREAYRASDGAEITIINETEIPMARRESM